MIRYTATATIGCISGKQRRMSPRKRFFGFLENEGYRDRGRALQYLYTIARNLCIDEYRKRKITEELHDDWADVDLEEKLLTAISLKKALSLLTEEERELLLLRYVK